MRIQSEKCGVKIERDWLTLPNMSAHERARLAEDGWKVVDFYKNGGIWCVFVERKCVEESK
jgi:hypothetical protein